MIALGRISTVAGDRLLTGAEPNSYPPGADVGDRGLVAVLPPF